MRVLFVNEGNSAGVSGQGRFESVMRSEVARIDGVDARFAMLAPMEGRTLRAAQGLWGPLWRRDLDFQAARWHALQALRVRALARRELGRVEPDVLHVHPHTAAFALGSVARRVPTVVSVDSEVWDWRRMAIWQRVRPWSRATLSSSLWLQRRALRAAALVVPWTAWAARSVAAACPGARIAQLHPGLDVAAFRPGDTPARARPRVLFVGSRFAEKGGEDLLAALAPALDRGDATLDVVTPGPVAERAGVAVHRLAGGDARLVELFRQADLFCLPSYGDAAPWVVLEAMACGLAVVGSTVGAVPEFLDEGRAGVLVEPGDVRGLRTRLEALIADRGRRSELGGLARARCERHYDSAANSARLVELMRAASSVNASKRALQAASV